jgi:hypothetical protein
MWIYDKETHKVMPEEEFGIAVRVRAEEKERTEMVKQALGELSFHFGAVMCVSYVASVSPANLQPEETGEKPTVKAKKNTPKQSVTKQEPTNPPVEMNKESPRPKPLLQVKPGQCPNLPEPQPKVTSPFHGAGGSCFNRGRSSSMGALGKTFLYGLLHI